MSKKVHVNGLEWLEDMSKFKEDCIKNYDEDSNRGYFPEVDVEYPKKFFGLHIDLPFLPEREKIKKCNKIVCDVCERINYVVHMRALKQALNHGFILKEVHRVIK